MRENMDQFTGKIDFSDLCDFYTICHCSVGKFLYLSILLSFFDFEVGLDLLRFTHPEEFCSQKYLKYTFTL